MNWMLVVMVFGTQPVKTDLVFDTLDRCLIAGDLMRSEQESLFSSWQAATRKTGGSWQLCRFQMHCQEPEFFAICA